MDWTEQQLKAAQTYLARLYEIRNTTDLELKAELLEREHNIGIGADCLTCARGVLDKPDMTHIGSSIHALKRLNVIMGQEYATSRSNGRLFLDAVQSRLENLFLQSRKWAIEQQDDTLEEQPLPLKLPDGTFMLPDGEIVADIPWESSDEYLPEIDTSTPLNLAKSLNARRPNKRLTPHEGWRGFYGQVEVDYQGNPQAYLHGAMERWLSNTMHATCGGNRDQCLRHIMAASGYGGTLATDGIDLSKAKKKRAKEAWHGRVNGQTISSRPWVEQTDNLYQVQMNPVNALSGDKCGSYAYGSIPLLVKDHAFPIITRAVGWGVAYNDEDNNFRSSDLTITEGYILTNPKNLGTKGYITSHLGIQPSHFPFFNWDFFGQLLADRYTIPIMLVKDYEDIEYIQDVIASGWTSMLKVIYPREWLEEKGNEE